MSPSKDSCPLVSKNHNRCPVLLSGYPVIRTSFHNVRGLRFKLKLKELPCSRGHVPNNHSQRPRPCASIIGSEELDRRVETARAYAREKSIRHTRNSTSGILGVRNLPSSTEPVYVCVTKLEISTYVHPMYVVIRYDFHNHCERTSGIRNNAYANYRPQSSQYMCASGNYVNLYVRKYATNFL